MGFVFVLCGWVFSVLPPSLISPRTALLLLLLRYRYAILFIHITARDAAHTRSSRYTCHVKCVGT